MWVSWALTRSELLIFNLKRSDPNIKGRYVEGIKRNKVCFDKQ